MTKTKANPWLIRSVVVGCLVGILIHLGWQGANEDSLRWAARATARIGFVFFFAAFFATSLSRLFPNRLTRWTTRNRRSLGLSFAGLHAAHFLVIGLLWFQGAPLGVSPFSVGWFALVMVGLMAITSNDWSEQRLGARWKQLHTFGGFLTAYVFGVSFLPAIQESRIALGEFSLLLFGVCCRFIVLWLDRQTRREKTNAHRVRVRTSGLAGLVLVATAVPMALANDVLLDGIGTDRREIDQTELHPLIDSRPGPTQPFGRAHPDAPPELDQFAFLIGEYECLERIRLESGAWLKFRALWRATYILGGMGIQDEYWTAQVFTTSIRIFDPLQKHWIVNFYRMPDFTESEWHGEQRGETMVMRRVGTEDDGPTFSEITEQGFRWHSGGPDPNWQSTCRRTSGPLGISKSLR